MTGYSDLAGPVKNTTKKTSNYPSNESRAGGDRLDLFVGISQACGHSIFKAQFEGETFKNPFGEL